MIRKGIVLIITAAVVLSIGVVYAVGPTNIIFKTSDGTTSQEVMRITSDGKVGIGTTTPKSKLDVNGGIAVGGTLQAGHWTSRVPQGNSIIGIGKSGDVGKFTSITIGTDGLPVVSYHDATNGDL